MYALTERGWLYEPLAATRGELGHETRPYRKHYAHVRLTVAAGRESEALGLVTPDDRRQYIVRWRSGLSVKSNKWFFEDTEGNWFQVVATAPMLGARRNSFTLLTMEAVTNPALEVESDG